MIEEAQEPQKGFHLDKSINVSHLLYLIVILAAAVGWCMRLESVSAVHTSQINELQVQMKDNNAEIQDGLQRIEDKLDRVIEKRSK